MKKFIAAILSLSLCGVMFAACGSSGTDDIGLTDQISSEAETTETETETETTKTETETTETETETKTETESETETADGAYASIEEFAKDSSVFSLPDETVSAADSLTYSFEKTLEGATEFYMDVEATDGSMKIVMALSGKDVYMKIAAASSDENLTVMIKDSVMYMMEDASKSGYYMTATDEMMNEYNVDEFLSQLNYERDFDEEIENAADLKTCKVTIDGREYTFETAENGGGFLFDGDKLYAIINSKSTNDLNALIIHDFSGSVPADIFEVPSDYELIDLEAAMGAEQ